MPTGVGCGFMVRWGGWGKGRTAAAQLRQLFCCGRPFSQRSQAHTVHSPRRPPDTIQATIVRSPTQTLGDTAPAPKGSLRVCDQSVQSFLRFCVDLSNKTLREVVRGCAKEFKSSTFVIEIKHKKIERTCKKGRSVCARKL